MEPSRLALASEQLVGFNCGSDNWIFADDSYAPSYWLILKRDSFSQYSPDILEPIDLLFNQFDFDALEDIYRLHDFPPSHDSWSEWQYRSEIQALVMESRIQVFRVTDELAQRLSYHSDTINSDHHAAGLSRSPIDQKRNALAEELGSDIATRWLGKEEADRLHFSRWVLTQRFIEVYDFGATAVDTVVDLIVGLKDVAVFVVTFVGNEIEFQYKVNSAALKAVGNTLTGDQEDALAALKEMGIVVGERAKSQQEFINNVNKKAKEGYKIFMRLYDDPDSRTLMWDFFESLYKSLSYRKQQTVPQRIVMEVGIEVLLALATGGAATAIRRGAQAAATTVRVAKGINMVDRIGPFTVKAVEHIGDLSKLLDKPALKTPEKPPMTIYPEDLPKKPKPDKPKPVPHMKKHDVDCFKAGDSIPSEKYPEYDKQVKDQQDGLNDMTVKEYLDGRENYKNMGRGDGKAQQQARQDYSDKRNREIIDELRDEGIFGDEAAEIANTQVSSEMSTLDALHNPDMIAGGKDQVTELGDRSVNRSIGSQWNKAPAGSKEGELTRVEKLDASAENTMKTQGPDAKMNVDMHRCK